VSTTYRSAIAPALAAILLAGCDPSGLSASQARAARAACQFTAGAKPSQTLAATDPKGAQIPIDHIVLMMQENRSFDAYFSHLTVPGQTVEAASDDATNPDPSGVPIQRFHWTAATASNGNPDGLDYYCFSDTDHGWDQTHNEYDNGALDGFVRTNYDDGDGRRSMGYYDESDIPYYYALARAFAISDHHFCSVLGPTWPNRFFYWAGTAYGLVDNLFPPPTDPTGKPYPNLFSELSDAGVSWKVYAEDLPSPDLFSSVIANDQSNIISIDQFYVDAQNGQLPSVSVVEGTDSGRGENVDEHPPQDMQVGEAFVAKVANALMASPSWKKSALFITYDEHGGEYDHVVPPPACAPDDIPAQLGAPGDTFKAGFDRYGFRTPLFVVSPYARHGFVSHEVVDHTSITRFVETRFNLPAMTGRDANAWPLLDMFDFAHPDDTVPSLPEAPIDTAQRQQCLTDYPPFGGTF
jgi:phospholipase C